MSKKIIFAFLLSSLWVTSLFSQHYLSGKVLDLKTGEPLVAAAVCLLSSDSSMVAYKLSLEDGSFVFDSKITAAAYLSVTSLGYTPKMMPMPQRAEIIIEMQSQSFELREVKVKSNRLTMREDTLFYQTSGFKMPQDKSIEDVLRKLPGITVGANGKISYNGKGISKFYIEGMDLLQGKYTLASKNLDAQKVKEVQVIENHQPIRALKGKSFTDQAALNIVLTDDARSTLQSLIELGGGLDQNYQPRYEARVLTMLFDSNHQNLSLYKSNNLGEQLEGEVEDLTRVYENQRIGAEEFYPFLGYQPSSLKGIKASRNLENDAHLFATNQLIKLSKPTTLRIQGNFIYDRQWQESMDEMRFFSIDSIFGFKEQESFYQLGKSGSLKVTYEKNDSNYFFKSQTEGILDWVQNNNQYQTENLIIQDVALQKQDYRQSFEFVNRKGKRTFRLASYHSYQSLPEYLKFGTHHQEIRTRNIYSHTHTELGFEVGKYHLRSKVGVKYQQQDFTSEFSEQQQIQKGFSNDLSLQSLSIYMTPSLSWLTKHVEVSALLPVSIKPVFYAPKIPLSKSSKDYFLDFEPKVYLKYKLGKRTQFDLDYTRSLEGSDVYEIFQGGVYSDYRNASAYTGEYNRSDRHNFGASYRYKHPMQGLFAHLNIDYLRQQDGFVWKRETEGVFQQMQAVSSDYVTQMGSILSSFSKSFSWWKLFLNMEGAYQLAEQAMYLNDDFTPYHSELAWTKLKCSAQPSRFMNFETSFAANWSHVSFASSSTIPHQENYYFTNETKLTLIPMRGVYFEFFYEGLSYPLSEVNLSHLVDAKLRWVKKNYEVALEVRNVFNQTHYLHQSYSSLSEVIQRSKLRPREVILKMSFQI